MLRLKEIREDRDLKQIDIANVLNVTQAQYCRYELGVNTLPLDKLNILADYYKTSTDYLLYRTEERKPYPKSIMRDYKDFSQNKKERVKN